MAISKCLKPKFLYICVLRNYVCFFLRFLTGLRAAPTWIPWKNLWGILVCHICVIGKQNDTVYELKNATFTAWQDLVAIYKLPWKTTFWTVCWNSPKDVRFEEHLCSGPLQQLRLPPVLQAPSSPHPQSLSRRQLSEKLSPTTHPACFSHQRDPLASSFPG